MNRPSITGIGSVSPFGVMSGPVPTRMIEPRAIAGWPTPGLRRAYLVNPFRPSDVVPGLKTRRLDRLSVWSLVAASLAVKDAGLDLAQANRSRAAVVFATGLGCVELTEAYFRSASDNGWSGVDPIVFPETLCSAPASHVARCLDLRGPNITASCKGLGGECALLQAASLIRNGQADWAVIMAGDTLTRGAYEWYEAACALSPACFDTAPPDGCEGFVPGEGVSAVVMESADHRRKRGARVYAVVRSGHFAARANVDRAIRKALVERSPSEVALVSFATSRGAVAEDAIRELFDRAVFAEPSPVVAGLRDAGGLLRLVLALNGAPRGALAVLASSSARGASAALLLELP
jgi:3-oxoacyl-(acyl-carrier-protein) synthase